MVRMRSLSFPLPPLTIILSESTCSHIFCSPRLPFSHALPTARAFSPHSCGGHTRMAERQNLSIPLPPLTIILSESTCSHIFCSPRLPFSHALPTARAFSPHSCGGHTRMAERQNLSIPLPPLTIILSESTCSHIFCLPRLPFSHAPPAAHTFSPRCPFYKVSGYGAEPHV